MEKVRLSIITMNFSMALFLMGLNIWDDIHIPMVAITMECIKITFQMEQDSSSGQMG